MKKIKYFFSIMVSFVCVFSLFSFDCLASTPTKKIKNLAIYYGYPSYVNGSNGNVKKAVESFKPFDVIVLGDGYEHPGHSERNKINEITKGLKPSGNRIFGYINIASTHTSNPLSVSTIKKYVDEWKSIGVTGVFYDCYGFDYGVTRDKQNELVKYAHSKGLNVFANAWKPGDAMGDKNEKGKTQKSLLEKSDYYLMEDWIADKGKLQNSKIWVQKADDALKLSQTNGVKIAVLATNPNPYKNNINYNQFKIVSYATAMYGFDAFQWQEVDHSASSCLLKSYKLPQKYGTSFIDDVVSHNSNFSKMTRRTNAGTFIINQTSTMTGNAKFQPK